MSRPAGSAPRPLVLVLHVALATAPLLAQAEPAQTEPAQAEPAQAEPASPWYLERGTAPRAALPQDEIPSVAEELALLMKDGGVPGFYDGQFASVAGRFDELAALVSDPDMHHVLRVMAIMALPEAGDGEPVAATLEPLLMSPEEEFGIEYEAYFVRSSSDDPLWVRRQLDADLSLHARFALAKDRQPDAVMAKVRVMENHVQDAMHRLLDPDVSSDSDFSGKVRHGRQVLFDIGYHYQQFDDYPHASEWFHKLCDNLPGSADTRWAHYNLACIAALTGQPDRAMDHLRSAYAVGFTDSGWMAEDGDLRSLRDRPDFKTLLATMRNEAPPVGEARSGAPEQGEQTDSQPPGSGLRQRP